MYLFLWGTLCNYTDEQIIEELKSMDNNWLIEWNYILLSYFTAPNTLNEIKELIEIYNSENNRAFHENWMEMLWLSKDNFEYDTIYETDNWLKITLDNIDTIDKSMKWPFPWKIKWIIRAKNDNTIKLSSKRSEKEIKITKGEEFTLHYSRRFTKEWIEKLFKKSGCNTIFTIDKKWDSIVLLKRNPTKLWKLRRTYQDVLRNILILWTLVWIQTAVSEFTQERNVEKTYQTYIEQQLKEPIGYEQTFYAQETEELVTALKLDKLHNKKWKKVIIDLFNAYVWTHKTDSTSTEELIQWFWDEQWWVLIRNYNLTHNPYDFITKDLIDETKNLEKEFSSNQVDNSIKVLRPNQPFEYNDSWKTYWIIKVDILGTPIYLAAKKEDYHNLRTLQAIYFSTDVFNDIKNKAMLDPDVLKNNNKFWDYWNLICQYHQGDAVVYPDRIWFCEKTNLIYLNWKVYFIKIAKTYSWKIVWLASESEKWEFTTTKFNEIAEEFSTLRKMQ